MVASPLFSQPALPLSSSQRSLFKLTICHSLCKPFPSPPIMLGMKCNAPCPGLQDTTLSIPSFRLLYSLFLFFGHPSLLAVPTAWCTHSSPGTFICALLQPLSLDVCPFTLCGSQLDVTSSVKAHVTSLPNISHNCHSTDCIFP